MKTWFHAHRVRKQRSETALPIQRHASLDFNEFGPSRPLLALPEYHQDAAGIEASRTTSRLSIERYLSAPLDDEPASVPAISAALKRQDFGSQITKNQGTPRLHHSRESSYDVNSEGRRTFYTSGSAPDSTGTSYSATSRTHHHQRATNIQPQVPELPKSGWTQLSGERVWSPERPTTSRTVDTQRSWAERTDVVTPGHSLESRVDYRAKAGEEIAQIQEKAKVLEMQMRRYKEEHERSGPLLPRLTDEMAYKQMADKPKLAWILGGDAVDAKSIKRPKSSDSAGASTIGHMPDRPSTSGTLVGVNSSAGPRKTRSSGALDDRTSRPLDELSAVVDHKPSKRPRFFCSFCHKRFPNRLEWTRHEQTIHIPEELWVCCPRTGDFPKRCPFCAKNDPSPSHLAGHNYLSCQGKPISERTFSRKDYFLQHISQEHRVSPEEKPLRLTELVEAWRHPLPVKQGHQALHCGFCGIVFASYQERTEHVAGHFMLGLDMMSWWSARRSHETTPPKEKAQNPNSPQKCCYCERIYENLAIAQSLHPSCTMYSCSFLPGMQYSIYPSGPRSNLEAVCCYCNETLVRGNGKVKGAALKDHITQHNFRNCNQRLYFSGQRFRQHLQDSHKTEFDGTLFAGWTFLLKSCKKEKTAVFEAIEAAPIRRAYTDPSIAFTKPKNRKKTKQEDEKPVTRLNFMDLSETPQPKKLRRKASMQTMPANDVGEVRKSGSFLTHAASFDLVHDESASPSLRAIVREHSAPQDQQLQHKPGFPVASHPVDGISSCPRFYRRRLDASLRNRLYIREDDGPVSKNSQRLFKKMSASTFGGLVLHSTLVGATPARLTNSVDIYSLH